MIAAGPIKVGGETSASEQKGVMQWTGTLFTAAFTELWRLEN